MFTDVLIIAVVVVLVALVVMLLKKGKKISKITEEAKCQATMTPPLASAAPQTVMADIMKTLSVILLVLGVVGGIAGISVLQFDWFTTIVCLASSLISFCIFWAIGIGLEMLNAQSAMLNTLLKQHTQTHA